MQLRNVEAKSSMIVILSPADRVDLVPEAKLESWAIIENQLLDKVTYHFIGFIDGRGRISTPIVEWNLEERVGRTVSGRHYELIGLPGDMDHVELRALSAACALRYKAVLIKDVTNDFVGKRH